MIIIIITDITHKLHTHTQKYNVMYTIIVVLIDYFRNS